MLATLLVGSARAEKLTITVTHDLAIARPAETIVVPWREVAQALPGALLQCLSIKDTAGRELPYQVTNLAPLAKDPRNAGAAYGELIFQHDFAAGEKSATFTVEQTATVAPPFPVKARARAVPERLDDFAWENDRVAHRVYGPALAAPEGGTAKEVLVSSGIDVWCKRVAYPIIDRWYNKGHDHYHTDEGEGMDLYQVGPSRGCGGTGIWDGARLHVSGNYETARILANGPIRAIFELTYGTWAADGVFVAETKRFIVDAGHQLDRIESVFTATGKAPHLTVGIGLHQRPTDRGQEPRIEILRDAPSGLLGQWVVQKSNGALGTAVIVPAAFTGYAEDERNLLALAQATPGQPLVYYAGAAWSRAGEITTAAAWAEYLAAASARVNAPVRVALTTAP